MFEARRRALLAIFVTALVGASVVPAATAGAATITACVKKKTGDVRIRSGAAAKKKCPKGWKRVRWNTTGPAGAQGLPGANGTNGATGAPGPNITVKDASGAVVGQLLGVLPEGGTFYSILRDGGIYLYAGSGQVYPLGSPNWKTSDCTGTAYLRVSPGFTTPNFVAFVGGPFRMVFRATSTATFGPTSAWKGAGSSEAVVATQLYRLNNTGTCVTDGPLYTGDLAVLTSVTAPPDFVGPLTIG
jgi:hypothetical protein